MQEASSARETGLQLATADSPAWSRLMGAAETAVKLTGLLAAFGYISLRAQLNRLGIPFDSSLGVEGYLRETYAVLAGLLDALLVTSMIAAVLLIVGVVTIAVWRLVGREGFSRAGARMRHSGIYVMTSAWMPAAILLLLILFYFWLMRRVSQYWGVNAIAVGSLDLARLRQGNGDSVPFLLLLWVCLTGYVLFRSGARARMHTVTAATGAEGAEGAETRSASLRHTLWLFVGVLLFVLALHIPLIDGLSRRDSVFTEAVVYADTGGAPRQCGLLVLTTSPVLELWQAHNGIGVVQLIPASRIRRIVAGPPIDLIALARTAAVNRSSALPTCIDDSPPGVEGQPSPDSEIKRQHP